MAKRKLLRWSWVRVFAVALVCFAGLVAPSPALASLESAVTVHEIWGSFVGTFSVTSFSSDATGNLVANGTVSGTLYNPVFEVSGTLDSYSVSPRPVSSLSATCQSLDASFETSPISLEGRLAVWSGRVSVSTSGKSPTLCKASRLIAKDASSVQIAATLNKFLSKDDP